MPKLDRDKLQFKSFTLELKQPPDEEGRFEGYAAVFGNVDSGGDIIEPGAFTKTLQENPQVPILWQHDPTEPIGVSVEMSEDDYGLKVTGQLELATQRGAEARALMQRRALKGLSIGYQVVKDAADKVGTQSVRRLKELKLWEWSPVTFAMNDLAGISAVKAAAALAGKSFYSAIYDDDYEQVGALLAMIQWGTAFVICEADEDSDESDDVAAMQSILGAIAALLASELAELGADDEDSAAVEAMSARIHTILSKESRVLSDSNRKLVEHAVEALTALLDGAEPAKATQPDDGAATKSEEPEVASTLRSLTDALRTKSTTSPQGA